MKIATLGGSFDPVHNGHLNLAENVYTELSYEKIIFFPTRISPFKQNQNILSPEHRLKMLLLATEKNPYFTVDEFELNRNSVSYTIDTVNHCYKKYKVTGKLGLVIGADLLQNFYEWKDANKLLELCDLIVGDRPSKTIVKNGLKIKNSSCECHCSHIPKYIALKNETLQISSTYIRSAILQNKAWRYLVPESVHEYIEKEELYRNSDNNV